MSTLLLGSLVIFCLICLSKHMGIFLLTLKACGSKNPQIKKKRLNNILIIIKLKTIFTEGKNNFGNIIIEISFSYYSFCIISLISS